ncbi:MAG TPA: sulfotransferase [Nodosilinea sp.]|nr:sulfotransferase [Nodosilinea sp.]
MDTSTASAGLALQPRATVHRSTPPVIVVGLPRSGSSYVAHVLSCLQDWFVFDDLYAYQKAQALGISTQTDLSLDREKLKEFIHSITWQLRAKIRFEKNFQVPDLSFQDTFAMEAAVLNALTAAPLTWPQVLEEWMMRLALSHGKSRWGYKTPQDFMHMDELTDTFPGVRFVYILRDPRHVLRSFKNLPRVKTRGDQDGESRQYHPAVYALYWRKAYQTVHDFIERGRAPVEIVKFEDLIARPHRVADRLSQFLNTTVVGPVEVDRSNSSFNLSKRRELTETEVALCEKIAGDCMVAAGYELQGAKPSPADLIDLTATSADFVTYQIQRVLTDGKARSSVLAFAKRLLAS